MMTDEWDELGEPSHSHTTELYGSDTEKEYESEEYIRVEGSLSRTWRGVSGCCDSSRIRSEAAAAFSEFIQKKKDEHPTLVYVTAGHGGGTAHCRKWEDWPNGRRCNGSFSGVPAWCYFRQP